MKRIGMFLAVAILVGTAWVSAAQAAPAWYSCTVNAIGLSSGGTLFIQLTDLGGGAAFTTKYFVGPSAITKEMLATGLTAVSSDLNVLVNTDITAGTFPTLNNMYLLK